MRGRLASLLLPLVCSGTALGITPPGYLDVPRVSVSDAAFFRGLFESSATRVVRGMMLGDSQETSPWGWGLFYVPAINARLAEAFGPCSESVLVTNVDMVERPEWLATALRSPCAVASPAMAPDAVLPGVVVQRLAAGCGQASAFRTVLLHDASLTVDPELQGGPWMQPATEHAVDLLAVVGESGASFDWASEPTESDFPGLRPTIAAGTVSAPPGPAGTRLSWLSTPVLSRGGERHLQVSVGAAAAGGSSDLVGIRFRGNVAPRGIVIQSFSRGGQRLVDLVQRHGLAGEMVRALGPSFAIIHLGANDAMEMTDPESWRGRLQEAIGWMRSAAQDPTFPIIIASDIRGGSGGIPFQVIDRMPAIAHEFAVQDPRIMAINLRRITEEEYLWGLTAHYLADSAHFRPYAQQLLARAFVAELCESLGITAASCGTDRHWADCLRRLGSACMPGGCQRMLDVEAATLGEAWSEGTSCVDADGDGAADECPVRGPADIDRDGFVGGSDLGLLLGAWATDKRSADLDDSGIVDGADLGLLLAAWSPP
jgi:hypothetical protein